MAQVTFQDRPLSAYFTDPQVRSAFARAERDTPPAAAAVEPDRAPVLTPGATELVEA